MHCTVDVIARRWDQDVKRSTTHGMNGEYVLNLYTLAGEWGTGSHFLVVPLVYTLGLTSLLH